STERHLCSAVVLCWYWDGAPRLLLSFPTRRSSDLQFGLRLAQHELGYEVGGARAFVEHAADERRERHLDLVARRELDHRGGGLRSEEHTSELQSRENLVCRLLLEKKKY